MTGTGSDMTFMGFSGLKRIQLVSTEDSYPREEGGNIAYASFDTGPNCDIPSMVESNALHDLASTAIL